ncbi:hypothetical protein COK80_09130 [Bacillus anthracis]|nr:hypothetical protein COK80_09130 [Bacillus anthracis]
MENIVKSLEIITKFASIPIIISILFYMINNINITDIEKKFLTNHQKLQLSLSNILINFIIGSITMMFPLYSEIVKINNIKFTLILFGIIALFTSVISYIMIKVIEWFNPIKATASITDEKGEWKILRVISKSQVVLRRKAGEDEKCQSKVTYRDLKLIKEQEINIYYELKKGKYSIFIMDLFVRGRKFVIIRSVIAITTVGVLITIFKVLNVFNCIVILFVLIVIVLIILTIVINIHIYYLNMAKKLYPEIFVDSPAYTS